MVKLFIVFVLLVSGSVFVIAAHVRVSRNRRRKNYRDYKKQRIQ